MATLLFLDTCAVGATIGLAENGKLLAVKTEPDARRLGEVLHTETAALLAHTGKTWKQIDGVAVVSGPGSYTGLRVGMAAAKGWCFAREIPLITLNRLEILLEQAKAKTQLSVNTALLLPARVGEWFAIGAAASGALLLKPVHLTQKDWEEAQVRWDFKKMIFVGTPGMEPAGVAGINVVFKENQISPAQLASLAEVLFRKNKFTDLVSAKPEYLKGVYINN